MRNELAERVYHVFSYAVTIQERLRRGDRPSLGVEEYAILGLLGVGGEGRRFADFGATERWRSPLGPRSNDTTNMAFLALVTR